MNSRYNNLSSHLLLLSKGSSRGTGLQGCFSWFSDSLTRFFTLLTKETLLRTLVSLVAVMINKIFYMNWGNTLEKPVSHLCGLGRVVGGVRCEVEAYQVVTLFITQT